MIHFFYYLSSVGAAPGPLSKPIFLHLSKAYYFFFQLKSVSPLLRYEVKLLTRTPHLRSKPSAKVLECSYFVRPQVAIRNQGVTWTTTKNCQWNTICIVSKVQRADGNAREKTWRKCSALQWLAQQTFRWRKGSDQLQPRSLMPSLFFPFHSSYCCKTHGVQQPIWVHALHNPMSFTAPNTHSSAELKPRQAAAVWLRSPTRFQRHSALNTNSRLHQLPLWAHNT